MPEILELDVTPDELKSGALAPERNRSAIEAIERDGVVILKGVVSRESIESLLHKSLDDLKVLLDDPKTHFNWSKGNVQQDPPRSSPYLFRDVLVNDIAIGVTKGVLGAGQKNIFYSGNTAMPSENRQPVHADQGQLWPNMKVVTPPYSLVVNVPLVDMSPENGSTEIWPGTHLDPSVAMQSGTIEVSEEALAHQRRIWPPIQPIVAAGSIVIRDMRMWHAGMPNRTSQPRPMIAMIHTVSWWPGEVLRFPKEARPFLAHPDLIWNVEFDDD